MSKIDYVERIKERITPHLEIIALYNFKKAKAGEFMNLLETYEEAEALCLDEIKHIIRTEKIDEESEKQIIKLIYT